MTKRILLLVLLTLSGCAHKLANLPKPTSSMSFVLAKDYARVERRGLFRLKWVEGLRAGTYTLVAEDNSGFYFLGEGMSVIKLGGDDAEKYLSTGAVAVPARGGLWLPKPGVEKDPKIWYEIYYGEANRSAAVAGGGIIGAMATTAAEGDILFIGYGSEKDFVNQLRIETE